MNTTGNSSSQEHNALVMKGWRGHKEMARMARGKGKHGVNNFSYNIVTNFSYNFDVKPTKLVGKSESLLPIWAMQLVAGASHLNRRLTGVVIDDAIFTGGIYFVIKDAIGDLVKIGVYNIPNASPGVAIKCFPRGKCVTIVEPYSKIGMDGLTFVRVDNPATEVLTESYKMPGSDPKAWQLEGNLLFAASMTAAAHECWTRALSFAAASNPVSTLLTNRAAALLRSERPAEAARDCFVALTINPQVKAAGRLVDALSDLGHNDIARTYAHGFVERWPELKSHLKPHLSGVPPSDWSQVAAETLWWEKEMKVSAVFFIQTKQEVECKDANWGQLKDSGNDLFRSGSFNDAAKVYSSALVCVEGVDVLIELLCNRAMAAMKEENFHSALTNATASLVLDPSNVKSWYRRACALSELGMNKAGLAACTQATNLLRARGKNNSAFLPLIKTMTDANIAPLHIVTPKISTAEQKKLLKEANDRFIKKDDVGVEDLSMFNLMLNFIPEAKQIELFGQKILQMPSFHLELGRHRGWPKDVDIEWAKSHLHFVFEQCRSLPYSMQTAFSSEKFEFPTEDLLKRANGHPARLKWLYNTERKHGDIMPEDTVGTIAYPQFFRQPFTNQAYRKELLSLGTVHVAVGFVDLGVLLICDIADAPKGRMGPLQFVGVELSCFAVAKSLAIWQMIKDAANSKTSANAILQVWFSSTWQQSTEVSFRSAVCAVRSQGNSLYGGNEIVSGILDHWVASKGVLLKRARDQWAESVTRDWSVIGHMKELEDRLDMATYEITGDVFVGDSAQLVGSICWWDCPDGTPANQFDQTFFSAINVPIVLKERSPGQSFFHAAEAFLHRRVAKLITCAGSGAITVQTMIGSVSDLVPQIAALSPWTMTWSNVSDYYKTSEFHSIARACSINRDTMHFAYSMNWTTDVVGTHIIDHAAEKRKELFKMGFEAMDIMYQTLDYKGVFRYPPPENPMKIADSVLAFYWWRNWIDNFFTVARQHGPCQVGNVEPAMFNPLSNCGDTTVFFTFTYDPEIVLTPSEPDSTF